MKDHDYARNRQIHDESQRMVGRTRAGRDYHIAYIEYDPSTFPHRRLDPRAACRGSYLLTNNMQKYTDLATDKVEMCYLCFGIVGQRR